jgi:hypothetical protein
MLQDQMKAALRRSRRPGARPGAQDEGHLLGRHRRQPEGHHGRGRQEPGVLDLLRNPFR